MDASFYELGKLAEAGEFNQPISIEGANPEILIQQLRTMLLIRHAEEIIGDNVASGKIKCPCHLGIGQEAVAVGVSAHLRKSDRAFGAHRSHSHFLAMGGDVGQLFAEVLGRETGCSKGMGGSMHIYDAANGFIGSVPIVSGTVSLAVGAGLAAKMDKKGDIGVAYFGDGAIEEGTVHESMNYASSYGIPVLFVCENNLFSSHLHISIRQPATSVARFAAAHKIPYEVVDGNDVVAVAKATGKLLEKARRGEGPGFLEAVTYRWRGHVGPREDNDVGVQRKQDLELWKRRDPVKRLFEALVAAGVYTPARFELLEKEVRDLLANHWKKAEDAPFPVSSCLLDLVYS